MELLFQGYSPRGVALALGCSLSTLKRRFSTLLAGPINLCSLSRQHLFQMAVRDKNVPALLYFGRALVREEARRAAREEKEQLQREEEEIQRRIRGEQ